MDAPHQLLADIPLRVYLLVKDADRYPVRIRGIRFRMEDFFANVEEHHFELDIRPTANLFHCAFPLPTSGFRGDLRITGRITVENARGRSKEIVGDNFPGLETTPLEVKLLEHPLPYPHGWHAGEMHCHSEFSSDPVEFGAPLAMMQEVATAAGLDFVLCTDHSYDFQYRREAYLRECDPEANFREYREQALGLTARHPERATLIPGEEVSCGNSRGENVHLLVFGHERFLPGLGDGGRRGFNNRPDLSLTRVLELLGDTPSFAAHPKARIGWLERKVFRRGEWRTEDLQANPGVRGLQFWNGHLGSDYRDGKAFWVEQLLRGRRLLPIGANDAHGDFNRNTGVRFPLLLLRQGRNHVFGKVRTVVPAADRSIDSLRRAFRGDRCVCTDGPFAELSREDGLFRIAAFSTPDYGALLTVVVYGAAAGGEREVPLAEWTFGDEGPMHFEERNPLPGFSGHARLEAITRKGLRAITSAVFAD